MLSSIPLLEHGLFPYSYVSLLILSHSPEKVMKMVFGILNFTSSVSLSVHQIRSHYLYVTAAGLSCCLQGGVSLDENIHTHTHTLLLTLPSVSLGSFACAMTHRAKCQE